MPRKQRPRSTPVGDGLPAPIEAKLQALIRRVRRIQILRGFLATLAAAGVAIIVCMLISTAFTILSPLTHAVLSFAVLLATGVVAFRTLIRPLREKISTAQMARVVETRKPELQERLSTALNLLAKGKEEQSVLASKVIDSAITDAKSIRPERAFTNRKARTPLITTASVAAILGLALLSFPLPAKRLLTRTLAPFSAVGNAWAESIHLSPGDQRVPEGDPVRIEATVRGHSTAAAEIRIAHGNSTESIEAMSLVSRDEETNTAVFGITFPSVASDFAYRIRSGRAISATHQIIAAPRPKLRRLEVTYRFPEYTNIPDSISNGTDQTISVLEGTEIEVLANFETPLESAIFKLDGNPLPATADNSTDTQNPRATWNFTMASNTDGTWAITLNDTEDIPSKPIGGQLISIPDAAPELQLLTDSTTIRLQPNARLELPYTMQEDFGITSAKLHLPAQDRILPLQPPTLASPQSYTGAAILDLNKVTVPETNTFQLFLEVTDSRPSPQSDRSPLVTIIVDPNAESLAEQFVTQQRQQIESALTKTQKLLQIASDAATTLPPSLVKPRQIPQPVLDQLTITNDHLADAGRILRTAAARTSSPSSVFQSLSPKLEQIANTHIRPALESVAEISLADKRRIRVHRAHRIKKHIDEAIADTEVALRILKEQSSRGQLLAKMSDLGQRQQQLAESLAKAADPTVIEALRSQQAELAKAMQQLVDDSGRSIADQLQDTRQDANKLADEAKSLAQRQTDLTNELAETQAPETLTERQNALANEAAKLAQRARSLQQQSQANADETALRQLKDAKARAEQAAKSASQAASHLGGEQTPGGFKFAKSPDLYPTDQNRSNPAPTQAGVAEESSTSVESPFSSGSGNPSEPPPASESLKVAGGDKPPGDTTTNPSANPRATVSVSAPTGSSSTTSAAQQSAIEAQQSLDATATALSGAAISLAQQAKIPGSQNQPQISQKMLEAARKAAQAAIENNPAVAQQIAQAIADSLNTESPLQNIPPPNVDSWQDISGQVKSGIASKRKTATPEGYRNLVKRYFKEISRRTKEAN